MNNPVSRFAYATSDIKMPRTKFGRVHRHKTTFSAGTLIPLMWDEVLPGDTFQVDLASLVRMSTPIHPVADDAFLDFFFFFTPNRIIWDHWKEFMGESPSDPYLNPIDYTVPHLVYGGDPSNEYTPNYVVPPKSILDYLGVPSNTSPETFNALPVRAYCKIWNEWFRDENLQHAIDVPTDDQDYPYAGVPIFGTGAARTWSDNEEGLTDYIINCARGGDLAPVNKYHDYFTSALIQPQKGDPVAIPLNGFAPVYAAEAASASGLGINGSNMIVDTYNPDSQLGGDAEVRSDGSYLAFNGPFNAKPDNLVADLSYTKDASQAAGVPYASVNDLRYALQLQHLLQNDARFGTRYRELIKGHFMVDPPEGELQVPEFLGGKRVAINMSQVLQTSATDDVSPQGNTAAYSLTTDKFSSFTKSFTEHGILMCVACVRTKHTYQQGLNKMFSRRSRYDYYFPELDNIPDQPIYNREIFLPNIDQTNVSDYVEQFALAKEIFGFQEAWAEYKYHPDVTSAEMRSTYPQSLDVWHYGDDYAEQPYLSTEWIRETRKNIDRTLAVQSELADQFIGDFYFDVFATRCMSMYSNGLGRTL